ncbi:unnamed protein product, partial [Effrenium voratum]
MMISRRTPRRLASRLWREMAGGSRRSLERPSSRTLRTAPRCRPKASRPGRRARTGRLRHRRETLADTRPSAAARRARSAACLSKRGRLRPREPPWRISTLIRTTMDGAKVGCSPARCPGSCGRAPRCRGPQRAKPTAVWRMEPS